MAKVSVVMSCHNSQQYIKEAIDSILNQSFTDFEFIIWNDGSSDNTEQIVKSYKDKRIRYFFHENTGLGLALSLACKEATGEYIARMDDDDISTVDRLKKQVDFLNSHQDYVLVSSSTFFINEKGVQLGRSFPVTWDSNIRYQLRISNPITHPASMFRRKQYLDAGGYMNFRSSQDKILWSRLERFGKFKNIEEPLLFYRIRLDSISRSRATSPYRPILLAITSKICSDEKINDDDIVLFNYVDTYRRKYMRVTQGSTISYHQEFEERLYNALKIIIGRRSAEKCVYFSKNIGVWFFSHIKNNRNK